MEIRKHFKLAIDYMSITEIKVTGQRFRQSSHCMDTWRASRTLTISIGIPGTNPWLTIRSIASMYIVVLSGLHSSLKSNANTKEYLRSGESCWFKTNALILQQSQRTGAICKSVSWTRMNSKVKQVKRKLTRCTGYLRTTLNHVAKISLKVTTKAP